MTTPAPTESPPAASPAMQYPPTFTAPEGRQSYSDGLWGRSIWRGQRSPTGTSSTGQRAWCSTLSAVLPMSS